MTDKLHAQAILSASSLEGRVDCWATKTGGEITFKVALSVDEARRAAVELLVSAGDAAAQEAIISYCTRRGGATLAEALAFLSEERGRPTLGDGE